MNGSSKNISSNISPFKKGGMFEGASHLIFEKAKKLRANPTPEEQLMWMYLRPGVKGYKFRRQHPISLYITDFYCHKLKLIVELDGQIHQRPEIKKNDDERQAVLEKMGYTVIRFTNQQLKESIESVIFHIEAAIENLSNNTIQTKTKPPLGGV